MTMHILSDLHIEFAEFAPSATDADVVILAGDIHIGRDGRKWIRRHFADRPVIYVLGNHEFYRHSLPKLTEDLCRETEGSLIHLLENRSVEIDGFTFLGCTLWTDFAVLGTPAESRAAAEDCMTDYQLIRSSPTFRRIRALDTQRLHIASRQWLSNELGKHNPAKAVVVTHHAPCSRSIPPYHAGEALTEAFCSHLNSLVATSLVPLWVHGHTHHCVDYRLGETRVLANQRGYPDAFCKDFDPGLVLEL